MELRTATPWADLLGHARYDAVHLEVRDTYAVPAESEPLRRFLAGEPRLSEPDEYWEAWAEVVKDATARGVAVRRVRVVTEPMSDYQRWLLTETGDNIEAGEDVRYLARHLVRDVPADDAWVVDGTTIGFNLVDSAGKPAGAAVTTDPGIVSYYRDAVERLWSLATPFPDYVAGHR